MNKVIVTMLAIIVVLGASITAVLIFQPRQKEQVEIKSVEEISQEEILDDCTDEYEGIQEDTLKANSEQEKTSPNCSLTINTYYKKCGHTTSQYSNLPVEDVNLTKEDIEEKYKEYRIEKFSSNELILYQEKEGECGEHYVLKDKEGMLTVYQILENGEEVEVETTSVSIEYLPDTDRINIINGIEVNGKQALNQLIEDFE